MTQRSNLIVWLIGFYLNCSWLVPEVAGQGLVIILPNSTTAVPLITNPNCQCTAPTNCADGAFGVDPRVFNTPFTPQCGTGLRYCCNLGIVTTTLTPLPGVVPTCGTQPVLAFPGFTPAAGQASYGEYPWMALVLGLDNTYIAGGVLIDGNTLLTVAHKVQPISVSFMKVRLGEFILNAATEPIAPLEILVSAVRIHPSYNSVNLQNDIAILKLVSFVNFPAYPNIVPICLPAAGLVYTGQTCWVAGWGASTFTNGVYSSVLREVDLPVVDPGVCQTALQGTRLGTGFILNSQAFLCAGGQPGKDACTGDGGSPLVCQSGTQWSVVGLVSWGIGCGIPNIPGVYVNIPQYIAWITANRF